MRKFLIAAIAGLAVGAVATALVIASGRDSAGRGDGTAAPTFTPSTSATASTGATPPAPSIDVAGPIPTLTHAPMDDAQAAPAAQESAPSDAQALTVAETYYDILVDTTLTGGQWRQALEPLTTPEQYEAGVRHLDGTWYDGLGVRTEPATLERSGSDGVLYAHISTTEDDDIVLVLLRATEADSWRVNGFRG